MVLHFESPWAGAVSSSAGQVHVFHVGGLGLIPGTIMNITISMAGIKPDFQKDGPWHEVGEILNKRTLTFSSNAMELKAGSGSWLLPLETK